MVSIGIGDTLQAARLARGEDLVQVAEALKIRRSHVVAMESENFAALGATPYARGHLRNYARYLGLDDVAIINAYDNQFRREDQGAIQDVADTTMRSSASPREPMPRWIVVTGVLVLLLAGIALIGRFGNSTPDAASPDLGGVPSVAPSVTPTPSAASEAPSEQADAGPAAPSPGPTTPSSTPATTPSPTPSPPPSPSPTIDGVELFLAFEDDCWLAITVDGAAHPESQTVQKAGETMTLEADDEVVVRYGNAGGVDVEFNGERLGSPGTGGEVVEVTYTPEGAESQA